MYTNAITLDLPHAKALTRVKDALSVQGFGILSEIDVRATFETKLGTAVAESLGDYIILGACNPHLASRGLAADPSLGALLPCNVVVRRSPESTHTTVEAIDPQTMVQLTDNEHVAAVATDADTRLRAALEALTATAGSDNDNDNDNDNDRR
ncbi:DUF302 domain-containing protein [Planctomonas deserti]|uniref:DUF302 domain-containing protein n=1 Tax=Planctomonas deserti TaxID=2144185 RepID=UPI000D33BE9A|nr:DUF302 domain-containing protein [Planctomonas deserti]